jgi:transketolase
MGVGMNTTNQKTNKELALIANTLRQDVIKMLVAAGSGHTAGPLGLAEIFSVLFFSEMKFNPKMPNWEDRDRFVLSNGHCAPILYAAMARAGFFEIEKTLSLRKLGSPFQGHPSRHWLSGIENSSGPLGEGLAIAAGKALVGKLDKKSWRVYCVTSDGEHQEGSTWEAVMFASKYKLDNLTVICDRNYIQIDGNTEEIMPLSDLVEKYRAFGWNAFEIDGHNISQIKDALKRAKELKGKPTMIVAKTIPGKGVKEFEGKYQWHGIAPNKEQGEKALLELLDQRKILEGKDETEF